MAVVDVMSMLDDCAAQNAPLTVRFACLMLGVRIAGHDGVAAAQTLCQRLRVPGDCRDLALMLLRERETLQRGAELAAPELMALLERCDALRRAGRFAELLSACVHEAHAQPGNEALVKAACAQLEQALKIAQAVDASLAASDAAKRGLRGTEIGAAVRQARIDAIAQALQQGP